MIKERIKAFDFIRSICILGIVQDHFLELLKANNIKFTLLEKFNDYGNLGWGAVGTAIFFMISGAVLMYNYGDRKISILQFYFNRFIRMCPILYFLHIVFYFIYSIIQNAWLYRVTWRNVIDVIVGKALVGEWFTTVIFVCYLLFPIFKYLFCHHRLLTSLVLLIVFVANQKFLFFTIGDGAGRQWASYTNGLFEFWLGMLFVSYREKLSKKQLPFLILALILMPYVSLQFNLEGVWFYIPTILCSAIIFLLLLFVKIDRPFVNNVSKCSYELYLIHHVIMYLIFPVFVPFIKTQAQCALFFVVTMVLIYISSKEISALNTRFVNKIKGFVAGKVNQKAAVS